MGSSRDIKRLSLTLTWKTELLVAKNLNSSMDTIRSKNCKLFFTAVDFLDFDQLKVKHPSVRQLYCWNIGMFRRNR